VLWIAAVDKSAIKGSKGHGTGIAIPYSSIECKEGESIHEAIKRIEASARKSPDGRAVSVSILIGGKHVRLASIYAPAKGKDRPTFFNSPQLRGHITTNTIVCIDANCVPDVNLDTHRPDSSTPYDNAGSDELATLIANAKLTDIAREQLGTESYFTAHSRPKKNSNNITRTRIDQIYTPHIDSLLWTHAPEPHFLVSDTLYPDHVTIKIALSVAKGNRGKDLLTIPQNVYDDPYIAEEIANAIKLTYDHESPPEDPIEAWLTLKRTLLQILRDGASKARKKNTETLGFLKSQLAHLNSLVTTDKATSDTYTEIQQVKNKIKELKPQERTLNETIEQMAYEKGQLHDIGSAAMYRKVNPKSSDQWVNAVMTADWDNPSKPKNIREPITDASKIANGFVPYYTSLFSRKSPDPSHLATALKALRNPKYRKVLKPTADACGAPITAEEIIEACSDLPAGKSPGPDRIAYPLYKHYAILLAPLLAAVYNQAHQQGSLPSSMTSGLISVLFKKKDRADPRNYRPISLLNSDYKILMRILTTRFAKAAVQFVSPEQNGFVPGGFIVENILLLQMLQAFVEQENEAAYYIFLDMEKAFDRCSWGFLFKGLEALGFENAPGGDLHPFSKFINLAYSHDHPPTRRLYINGYLSNSFPLNSGVAQGCPLSPLIFLVFTEVLIRLCNQDDRIQGIEVDGHRHKISMYADDSTLIAGRKYDIKKDKWVYDHEFFDEHLKTYCGATGGLENADKREALLLGSLRNSTRPPEGVIKDNKFAPDGESIRALGFPLGNKLDYKEWWLSRYRTVKHRVALWPSTASMTTTGRNMLLQSKYYGSFRYWLFALVLPDPVSKLIEEDANYYIWSAAPELQSDELGTSAGFKRQSTERASYLSKDKGGFGLMHWPSHVKAFRIHWILRYVDPRKAPWKQVLDHWIAKRYHIGRGILFVPKTSDDQSLARHLPLSLSYLRKAIRDFEELNITQDISQITRYTQAEPIFQNPRFNIKLNPKSAYKWQEHLETFRVMDLIDHDTHEPFTVSQWNEWFYKLAPLKIRHTPSVHEYAEERAIELPLILNPIPPSLLKTISEHTSPIYDKDGVSYIALYADDRNSVKCYGEMHCPPPADISTSTDFMTDKAYEPIREQFLIRHGDQWWQHDNTFHEFRTACHNQPHSSLLDIGDTPTIIHEITLDVNGYPHRTGNTIPLTKYEISAAATWNAPPDVEHSPDNNEHQPKDPTTIRIAGPISSAFPPFEGWYLPGKQTSNLANIMSISTLTAYLTEQHVGDTRPSAETNWHSTKHAVSFPIPWQRIWKSFGTPLSDPTEEKVWRKLVNRALNVRNRDSRATSKLCRLGCKCEESQRHLAQCPFTATLWIRLREFLNSLPGRDKLDTKFTLPQTIIFNIHPNKAEKKIEDMRLIDPLAAAAIRHMWNQLYYALTFFELHNRPFSTDHIFHRTLLSLRDAAFRLARKYIIEKIHHRYKATKQPSPVLNPILEPLLSIDPTLNIQLTDSFAASLEAAEICTAASPPS